jgi:hypothetical protein
MMLTSALEAAHIHLARRRNAASIERSRDAEEMQRRSTEFSDAAKVRSPSPLEHLDGLFFCQSAAVIGDRCASSAQ